LKLSDSCEVVPAPKDLPISGLSVAFVTNGKTALLLNEDIH